MRVLVVEDEILLARNIAEMLRRQAGCAVDLAGEGQNGLHMALSAPYDLVVLDRMLPDLEGLEILHALRGAGRRTPVLVLTARDEPDEIVRALDRGCDDYLTKPFRMAELLARCRALIRRSYDRPDPVLRVDGLEIDTARRQVVCEGRRVELPAMEYRLLEYLALRAGQVVSKEQIIEHLYESDSDRYSNVIEVYVSMLRRRLGAHRIRTLRAQGYVLGGQA